MATIWIGIDDTDSPRGGCTTWVLTELVRLARDGGIDLIGEPRLVRLNPNVPWKTRGNAALAARFGRGQGSPYLVGEVGGASILAYPRGSGLPRREAAAFRDAAWRRVQALAAPVPYSDPALVASSTALPGSLYWSAVREVVPVGARAAALDRLGADCRTNGSRRGLIGASAAIAWPGRRATWEVIAYREPARWGTPREVDAESVRRAQRAEPELFLCHDARTRRLLVAPHSPCPILFGLRSTGRDAPVRARARVLSEPVERWMVFRTNQGTGDHLRPRPAEAIAPYFSAIVQGTVASAPRAEAGGHVHFDVIDATSERVPCLAFEPTKTLPKVAQSLVVGDRVRVWGSRGRAPGLRLEGIAIVRLVARTATENPRCPDCRRPTRSRGHRRGFECPGCRRRWPPESERIVRRAPEFPAGTYHPTPSARRHLAVLAPEVETARA
ncbi:MAG: tRNA(Ile)(2)-agmatinylcytidine synthase [Thermoplasmata archaeon]